MFTKEDFKPYLNDFNATSAAEMANIKINKFATVLYGQVYKNGSTLNYQDFTSTKKNQDTHVILALLESLMHDHKPVEGELYDGEKNK